MTAASPVTVTAFLARASQLGLFSAETLILLDRGVAEDRIGLVMAAAAAGGALAQLAASRWGHRCRTSRTTLLGTALQSLGCLAFAALTPWWSLAAADFLVMAGAALTATGLRATLATPGPGGAAPEPERLERAYGRLTAAQMLGALVGPLGAGTVLLYGSAWAAWSATAVALAAMVVAGTADRRHRVTAGPAGSGRPAPAGVPSGPPAGLRQPTAAERHRAPGAGRGLPLLCSLWPPLVLLLGITALYGGYSVVWAVYLRGLGAPDALIAWSAACLALPALVLSPRAGAVLPAVPRVRLVRRAALLLGCCACLYPLVGSVAAAVALALTEGVLLAVALPLVSAQVARDAGPGRTARAFGFLGMADALGSGLGTAMGGALLAQGGAGEAFRFSGALCLLCAAVSLIPLTTLLTGPASPPSPSTPPSAKSASTPPPPTTASTPPPPASVSTRPSPTLSSSPAHSASSPSPSSEIGRSPHVSRPSPRIRPVRR